MDITLPQQSITAEDLKRARVRNREILPYNQVQPQVLLGLDNAVLTRTIRSRVHENLVVSKTPLGSTLEGKIGNPLISGAGMVSVIKVIEENIERMVFQFIECENFGLNPNTPLLESEAIQRARFILSNGVKRVNGRYESPLLWASADHQMPDNSEYARTRYLSFERSMSKNPRIREAALETVKRYIDNDYWKEVHPQPGDGGWILPIFASDNGRKVRLVWDAAAVYKGVSLNQRLLPGPDINEPLWDILVRFRERPVAICADIKEMFHRITIKEEDRKYQRVLWRWDPTETLKVYEMQVMTFGASCSPCIAQFVKNENAKLFQEGYPEAVSAIIKSHYVDDWAQSCKTDVEAIGLLKEVMDIQRYAGFELHKWASNSVDVLATLDKEGQVVKPMEDKTKVLGIAWDTEKDAFYFDLNDVFPGEKEAGLTKREILRKIMKIYDPLGLISHMVIGGRLILREVWRIECDWDEEVPENIKRQWNEWLYLMQSLQQMRIPRWSGIMEERRELHIFVDASDKAISAVAYIRGKGKEDIETLQIAAKCRVAPMRMTSIPRLELQGALLGVRLAEMIIKASSTPIMSVTYWTDARDVIWWLRSSKRKYKPYVAIRISEILVSSKPTDWKWLPSKLNPADLATKMRSQHPGHEEMWVHGPAFLRQEEGDWPIQVDIPINDTNLEVVKILHIRPLDRKTIRLAADPTRVSSWLKLVRVTAWSMRLARHLFRKRGPLEVAEIRAAEFELYREAQLDFSKERKAVEEGMKIWKGSEVWKLPLFIDSQDPEQLLRLRSRLMKSKHLPYTTKVPIVLPRKSPITRRIVEFYHEFVGHQNHQTTLNLLRRQFVIVRAKSLLNRVVRTCQQCAVFNAKPAPPQMASLPLERLSIGIKAFTHTGMDCFGPIWVTVGRRTVKRWGLLFVCLTTRAIEVEILESMDGPSCVAAMTVVFNRRTVPNTIRCDNGTNFVWAAKVYRGRDGKTPIYKFNPPRASHMGGSWERFVGLVKISLRHFKLPKNITMTGLKTFISDIIELLNCRPLTEVPIRHDQAPALTPNHFLKPCLNDDQPEVIDVEYLWEKYGENKELLKQWWNEFSLQYLPQIGTPPKKWRDKVEPLQEGDVVYITYENGWLRGRISDVFIDPECNQVREVNVFTPKRTYRRAATQVAKIRIIQDDLSNHGPDGLEETGSGEDNEVDNHAENQKEASDISTVDQPQRQEPRTAGGETARVGPITRSMRKNI